jgi:DNA-binding transcriptional ArsR family regulator
MTVDDRHLIHHPERDAIRLEAVLHALSDPVRLEIVRELAEADDERRCGSFQLRVTKSTMTHHFKVLREAGIIRVRQEATLRLTSLRREDLDARFPRLLDRILEAAQEEDEAAQEEDEAAQEEDEARATA